MMILALVALFCFNVVTPSNMQEVDDPKSEPTSKLLVHLRELAKSEEDGMENQDLGAPQSRTLPDDNDVKRDRDVESSTVLHSRVKRFPHGVRQHNSHRHGSWGCTLTTCQTHNLANWLYQMAANKGKDGTAPKNTADPHSYGKRRRRRSIFFPGYTTRRVQ
ncbi:pro-adrenomedullin-like [Narcine bancroftii]|uniref:pro-adrenomedullin-like n=1 Tax=Narcine bancroftii TaxID=1343680 RepID=UPI0038311FF8